MVLRYRVGWKKKKKKKLKLLQDTYKRMYWHSGNEKSRKSYCYCLSKVGHLTCLFFKCFCDIQGKVLHREFWSNIETNIVIYMHLYVLSAMLHAYKADFRGHIKLYCFIVLTTAKYVCATSTTLNNTGVWPWVIFHGDVIEILRAGLTHPQGGTTAVIKPTCVQEEHQHYT